MLESKVSAEGRVSIPADIRHRLGLQPGDRVQFVLDEDGVRLVTARSLAEAVWARNTGGDALDAGEVIRATREADDHGTDREDRPLDTGPSTAGEDEFLASLFPAA
jgi:AbrB family looped-hinge helix DNA binding protein